LLVDINRTQKRGLFSEFSRSLSDASKQQLIETYSLPYRNQLYRMIEKNTAGAQVLHLSMHSFAPNLNGKERNADIGILYDPSRKQELQFACDLQRYLKTQTGLRIRRNYPYLGRSDGLTSWLRRQFSQPKYIGLEIECNQALLGVWDARRFAGYFVDAIVKIDESFQ
jgi:predicted N-formylglutamate amidohydrolase